MLPGWLSKITNAGAFAAPGGQPNFGDALQGIGNSMMTHYRRNMGTPGPAGQPEQDLAKAKIEEVLAGLGGQFQPPPMFRPPTPLDQPMLFPNAGAGFLQAPIARGL